MHSSMSSRVRVYQVRWFSAVLALVIVPAKAPAQADIILVGGAVFTADSTRPRAEAVALKGDRIQAVGSEREIRALAGPGTRVVDLRGRTVLPGLIDAHVHLLPSAPDGAALRKRIREELPTNLARFLRHGITSVRSTGDAMPYIMEIRDRLNSGELAGPRLVVTGATLTSRGGHPASTLCRTNPFCRSTAIREVADPDSARGVVRDHVEAGVDQIKIVVDSILGPIRFTPLSDLTVQAIVDEAHRHRRRVLAHALDAGIMLGLAAAGVDEFIHAPERGTPEQVARLAADLAVRRTPVTTTVSNFAPYRDSTGAERMSFGVPFIPAVRANYERLKTNARRLSEAGVPIALGTDCCGAAERLGDPRALQGARTLYEMEILHSVGLSSEAVLIAATRTAARVIGMEDVVGTITGGKLADLLIVDGDPIRDFTALHSTVAVVRDGRVVYGRLP
jgi:imidazolonepropionase-like amidohydrolase